jgi:SNF2 family DNA or RNA helicase
MIELSKGFDKIYLLSRKDLKQCVDSWAYLNYNRGEIDFETEYYWEKTPNYDECEMQIYNWNNKLNLISNELNIPIIYYEDIFDSTKNRLRKGDKAFDKKLI